MVHGGGVLLNHCSAPRLVVSAVAVGCPTSDSGLELFKYAAMRVVLFYDRLLGAF